MLTVRLDERLDALTRKAAAAEGASLSEFMRRAITERAEKTLAGDTGGRLSDVIGTVHGGGRTGARDSGGAFADLLDQTRRRT